MFWLLSATVIFLYLLYKFTRKPDDYFDKKSLKYAEPESFFKVISSLFINKKSLPEFVQEMYSKFPDEK